MGEAFPDLSPALSGQVILPVHPPLPPHHEKARKHRPDEHFNEGDVNQTE